MPAIARRELPPTGILQPWVAALGLRHQGVLLTAVRGCDTAPKEDPSKNLSRAFRGEILHTHCADPKQSASFIELAAVGDLAGRMRAFRKNLDHYPHHFVMHIVHASEIVGFYHPDTERATAWHTFYLDLCHGLHTNPETSAQLDARLSAGEIEFGAQQRGELPRLGQLDSPRIQRMLDNFRAGRNALGRDTGTDDEAHTSISFADFKYLMELLGHGA